jgi:lipid-A-disaccharide synthase
MAVLLDEMMCLFPFEEKIFSESGLKTTFVGHPLVDELEEQRIDVVRSNNIVGLFPGSREREVARLFPMMLGAVALLAKQNAGLQFEAPAAAPKLAVMMRRMLEENELSGLVKITDGGSHHLMQKARCGVIASGTATLEAAYYGLPYCLVYKVAWPTYLLGKILVKIEHIGLVNILAGRTVVKEFIQRQASPELVAAELHILLDSAEARLSMQQSLAETAALLGGTGAHERAATVVAGWLMGTRKK